MSLAQGLLRWLAARSVGSLAAGRSHRLPSLVKAMRRLVSRSVIREVVGTSHDRRQWGVLAAAWVGVSEREFSRAAAREMGLEFEETVPVPDLAPFGERARELLKQLRRAGCSVSISEGTVEGFLAIDPAEVREVELYTGAQRIAVAPWSEIARALDGAERMIAEREANADVVATQHNDQLCARILAVLAKEASLHGASAVEVVSAEGKTRYQFLSREGKTGVGNVHSGAAPCLLQYLARREGATQAIEGQEVFIRALGNLSSFRLSWGEAVSAGAPPAAAPPPEPVGSPSAGIEREAEGRQQPSQAVSILVIDDNPMFCRVLERLLKQEGFDPCFADNGIDAFEKLQGRGSFLPCAIICDLHMPRMNGREVLERLKADARLAAIPVVVLTSDEDVEAEVMLLKAGAAAFISKSKDPRILSAQVRRLAGSGPVREAA